MFCQYGSYLPLLDDAPFKWFWTFLLATWVCDAAHHFQREPSSSGPHKDGSLQVVAFGYLDSGVIQESTRRLWICTVSSSCDATSISPLWMGYTTSIAGHGWWSTTFGKRTAIHTSVTFVHWPHGRHMSVAVFSWFLARLPRFLPSSWGGGSSDDLDIGPI